jgi:putative tryptophan/tyrosine transport system substrate-binding protein
MRRREFIAGTAATALAGFAQPTCAQTSARPGVKRLAIFHPTDPPEEITSNANRAYKAYFDELKKHGYTEGQNLIVERYSALGHPDRIEDLAREIVANHPDVVLPLSGVFLKEFMALHSFIPMVGPTADPVAFGVASNLARPDKHFTGVVIDAGLEIWPKRFQLLLETARKMTKLGFLNANPVANPLAWGRGSFWAAVVDLERPGGLVRQAAQGAGIPMAFVVVAGKFDREVLAVVESPQVLGPLIVAGELIDRAAYERTFDLMEKAGVDGLIVSEASEHFSYRQVIVDLAAKFRIPPSTHIVSSSRSVASWLTALIWWTRSAALRE